VRLTEDALLGGRVRLRQPETGYRAAIDPVLLAAAVPARAGDRVVELGIGAGAAALCLARRVPGCVVVGIEKDPETAALARDNAVLNGVANRLSIVEADVAEAEQTLGRGGFDHAMMNPPYLEPGGSASPHARKDAATVESGGGLALWIGTALSLVRHKGSLTVIHRADRIEAVLAALAGKAGGIVVFPLWPKAGSAAKRILVQARKGIASPSRLAAGLVLHDPDGRYTEAAEAVLRGAASLEI
jgi:tRNA1(Val) A37 N6-methylase TrmN6